MTLPKATILWMPLLLLLPACRQEAVESVVPDPQAPEWSDLDVRFMANVERENVHPASRGTLMGNLEADQPNDENEQSAWRIWPWITGDEFTANALYYFDSMTLLGQNFMHDVAVGANVTPIAAADPYTDAAKTIDWSYAPVKQWPNQGYLDFFAYYPSKELLSKMRINVHHEADGITLPGDMPEDDLGETTASNRRTRGGAELIPPGLSSLRFWHESPLDTVITFRCKMHPAAIEAPPSSEEGIIDNEPVIEYNDATVQPDLMFAHHPHMAKPSVSNKVQMSFTHSMMAVRFWLKGIDAGGSISNSVGGSSSFRNISDFTINSISFGPVYIAGECVAYDNTDWNSYYQQLDEATQYSDEHVKLRYVWKYGEDAPSYTVKHANGTTTSYTMAPPYGGCEYRIHPPGSTAPTPNPPLLIDPTYPLPDTPLTDIFTQRCNFSIKEKYAGPTSPFTPDAAKTGWQPATSLPILPILDARRGINDSKYSAFIIPPQMFLKGNPYVKITYTITEQVESGTAEKMTITTETVPIPMTDDYISIEDGEILDLYLTFNIDGDEFFKFFIDAQTTPWLYGGEQEEEWKNW